jgi:hypothetical protein
MPEGGDDEGRNDLLDLISHDLINQQQAALGFLELLQGSTSLSDGERALLGRTVEALEHTARLLLQVRMAIIQRGGGAARPTRIHLDRTIDEARRTAEGSFSKGKLTIDTAGVKGPLEVVADELLTDMVVQLFLLLGDSATPDRDCRLEVDVEESADVVSLGISSAGFALDPMVTAALTGSRELHGWTRNAASISLVRHLLRHYGAEVRMEPAPAGKVGARLVIDLRSGRTEDAVDYGGR